MHSTPSKVPWTQVFKEPGNAASPKKRGREEETIVVASTPPPKRNQTIPDFVKTSTCVSFCVCKLFWHSQIANYFASIQIM